MGVINRTARGLLSLLDSQTQGVVPSSLGEVIAPTLDMAPYLAGAKGFELVENASNGTTIGEFGTITIPAGQSWLLYGICSTAIALDTVPGETLFISPGIRPSLAFTEPFAFSNTLLSTTDAIGERSKVQALMPVPLMFSSGAILSTSVLGIGAVAPILGWSFQTQALIIRLQV